MIQPIRNQVLVKPFPSDDVSSGGIYIPLSAQNVSNKVLVVNVGNGTIKKPMKLKPGEIGYRVKNWGVEVVVDGELHFLMESDSILAKE